MLGVNLGWFIFSAYKNEGKSSLACQLDPNSGNLNSFHIQLVANDVCVCPSLILALWPSQSWGHPDFFPGSNFSSICLHQSPRKVIWGSRNDGKRHNAIFRLTSSPLIRGNEPHVPLEPSRYLEGCNQAPSTWRNDKHAGMQSAVPPYLQASLHRSKFLPCVCLEHLHLHKSVLLPRAIKKQGIGTSS